MILCSSVEELVKYEEEGATVFVPRKVFQALSQNLSLGLLREPDRSGYKLFRSDFYTLAVPTLVKVLSSEKISVGLEGEISPGASLINKIRVKVASVKSIVQWERKTVSTIHPALVNEAYVRSIVGIIEKAYDDHRIAIAGRPVFLMLSTPKPSTVKLLEKTNSWSPVPVYIMVPVTLSKLYLSETELIKKLERRGARTVFLSGLGTERVFLKKKKQLVEKSLAKYLVEKEVAAAISLDDYSFVMSASSNIAATVLEKAYGAGAELNVLIDPEKYYSLSTVFLNTLFSIVTRKLQPYIDEHHGETCEAIGKYLFETALLSSKKQVENLLSVLRMAGLPVSAVKTMSSARVVTKPYALLTAGHDTRSGEEKLLYTHSMY